MVGALRAVLEEQRGEAGNSPWVWPSPRRDGHPLQAEPWVARIFKPAAKKANVGDFHFHDLRHTTASRAIMAGQDLIGVRDMLGHSSVSVTQRYSHLAPDHLRRVAESIAEQSE